MNAWGKLALASMHPPFAAKRRISGNKPDCQTRRRIPIAPAALDALPVKRYGFVMTAPMLSSDNDPPRRPRTWADKFGDAFRGLKFGIRGQSSFAVHFFIAAAVVVAAAVLRCSLEEWGLLVVAVGLVLTTELVNTSIETLFRGLDHEIRERSWPCLDIAAAAVLIASITAAIIGIIVFGRRIVDIIGG
jgi:diacylglycerol kinase